MTPEDYKRAVKIAIAFAMLALIAVSALGFIGVWQIKSLKDQIALVQSRPTQNIKQTIVQQPASLGQLQTAQDSTGDIGQTGLQGAMGPMGLQGPTGEQGPQGSQGTTGATGSRGPRGEKGDPGPQGTAVFIDQVNHLCRYAGDNVWQPITECLGIESQ